MKIVFRLNVWRNKTIYEVNRWVSCFQIVYFLKAIYSFFILSSPNTYRVLIGDAEHWGVRDPLPVLAVPDHLSKRYSIPETNNAPRLVPDLRHNNPQPWHCSFLRNNVRTLNDPVCHVATYNVKEQQPEWWRTDIPASKSAAPPHTEDSTFRADFKRWDHNRRATRHSSNPNTLAAAGIGMISIFLAISIFDRV